MSRYTITEETGGGTLGTFEAETEENALDAMSRSHGYEDHADHLSTLEPGSASFHAVEVESEIATSAAVGKKIADAENAAVDHTCNAKPTVAWTPDDTTALDAALGREPTPEEITAARDAYAARIQKFPS